MKNVEASKNRYKPIFNLYDYGEPLTEEAINNQLKEIRDKGFGGIGINGRTNNKELKSVDEWLSVYMQNVKIYCDTAKQLDLEVWIFDEWGFPSGGASGLVLTEENRAKKLNKAIDITLEAGETLNIPAPERLLSVGVFPVDRFAVYGALDNAEILTVEDVIKYEAKQKCRIVAVTWENCSFVTHELRNIKSPDIDKSTVGTVDIMDAETVRKFLDNMHERYVPYIGDEFGKTVKGFFYDEPEICWDFPYSPGLPEYFEKLYNYKLTDILPIILAYTYQQGIHLGTPQFHSQLKKSFMDYTEAWNKMLAENFYGQIEKWCHKHNMLSVGHQDLDHEIELLNTVSGSFFYNSLRNDMPGVDIIWDNIIPEKFADFPRLAGSVKYIADKSGAMSETFAAMGHNMPPDVMRFDLEHQILRGIDRFFLYVTGQNPERFANGGEFQKDVMQRATFINQLINAGEKQTKIALYVPTKEITYERMQLNPHKRNAMQISDQVNMISEALCYAPLDFDYVWEEGLGRLGDKNYQVLILPRAVLSRSEVEAVEGFRSQGGRVISVFENCEQTVTDAFYYNLWELVENLPKSVMVESKIKRISMTTRQINGETVYAFLNESERETDAQITFPTEEISYLDIYSEKWIRCNGSCRFKPRELKIFKIGAKGSATYNVAKTIELTEWSFNGERIEKLIPWTELGLVGYSGTGEYQTEFDWNGGMARIDLGEVAFSAMVYLNNEEYSLPFSPWVITTELPKGHYELKAVVTNSGASRDYATPDKWCRPYDQPYLRCGLLGQPKIELLEEKCG